jgi:hypothetical protein
MTAQRTITWLKIASGIVIGSGALIAVAAAPAGTTLLRLFMDLAFWPLDGAQDVSGSEIRLISAVSGGMMVGWGLLLWQITTRLLPRDPELARSLIITSVATWFVIDSLASVVAGAPANALFNVGFLALFVLPLWRPARAAPG